MAEPRKMTKVAGGAIAALAVAVGWGLDGEARAAKSIGGNLAVLSVNVRGRTNVPANEVIDILFSSAIDAGSVSPGTIYVRAQNANQTGFTKQIPGSFNVSGNTVRFFPRLPGHRRDESGAFYPEGSANDDATLNAGLQPAKNYQITIVGRPSPTAVRSTHGKVLRQNATAKFTTASATDPETLYTTRTYSDSPPPQFSFSNPPDTVPTPDTQYATRGGTKGVPNDISIQLYCTRVPLSPVTARVPGNVVLTMVERYGNPALARPAQGSVFVEQNSETTLLVFKPRFPLADQGEYSLRVSKNVKDLTEQSDFLANRNRDRLRQVYEFLATERANNPGVPAGDLSDPPQSLVGDWPPATDTEARAILKTNVLILGDSYPAEIDPRVMVLFSTRDEPITSAKYVLEFRRSENLFDAQLSTADWDIPGTAPDVAQGVFTFAAGSVVDGDFLPKTSVTLTATAASSYTFNFRNVVIPQGVVVTIGGTRPATIKCLTFQLDGTISADGVKGGSAPQNPNYTSATYTQAIGGAGGPGGGKGGDSAGPSSFGAGGNGVPGVDLNGLQLPPGEGGLGGQGGAYNNTVTGSVYASNGGGGGGGGARLKGENGAASGSNTYWQSNAGGLGGAGSSNDDMDPLGGGAGGGAGGSGSWPNYSWGANGGAGGGGGGALTVQTAGTLTIGAQGLIRARGGQGGQGSFGQYNYWESGPGAGGGGGSLLLRSAKGLGSDGLPKGFAIANPATATDTTGGARGIPGSGGPVYGASYGGAGGAGYVGFQDPTGATAISASVPGSKSGVYYPVGAGVPSYVYTKWVDLGNEDPRILKFDDKDPDDLLTANLKDNIKTYATDNDAVYVEMQMTREDTSNFGNPNTSKIDSSQNSTNLTVTSQWNPIKVHDNTTITGSGAFNIPGYDKAVYGSEYAGFSVDPFNGHGYRFVRFRVFFQCDQTQTWDAPLPNIDFLVLRYQYNL